MFYDKTILDSGVTVLTEHMDGVRSAALGFWVRIGGRDEAPHEYGMSHFMEHMLFKGTPTRSALDISTAFDELGADYNAFTSREYTCFYTRLIDERLTDGFEILADMIVNASFTHDTIVPERQVVLEEIARTQDTPEDYVYDVFADCMYPKNALGRPILGTKETVSAFDTEQMRAYHDAHYTSSNIFVVACGNVDHAQVVALAQEHLANTLQGERLNRKPCEEEQRVELRAVKRDSEQAHILYGMPTISAESEQRHAYGLLDIMVGGGMSSRLFQEIREKRGLVYSVYTSTQLYEGSGVFYMYAGTRPDNIGQVLEVAQAEFAKALQEGLTQKELDRAKELACGNFVLGMESTRTHMSRLGRLVTTGRPLISIDETLEKYRAVTLEDINEAAKVLYARKPTIAIVSPYEQEEIERMLS